jgi:hypothetical protein
MEPLNNTILDDLYQCLTLVSIRELDWIPIYHLSLTCKDISSISDMTF